MASAVLFERQPFDRIVRCRTVANVLSMRIRPSQVLPMLGGEIVKGEQRIAICQTFTALAYFGA